jgi:hypothetical protein
MFRRAFRYVRQHLLLGLGAPALLLGALGGASAAHAADPACATSAPPSEEYAVEICIVRPADGAEINGIAPVETTVEFAGEEQRIRRLIFYLDGEYLLTEYEAPYLFDLPTETFVPGSHTLTVTVDLPDDLVAEGPPVTVTIAGQEAAAPAATFTPHTPEAPDGKPLLVAATGDGAGGETSATLLTDQIVAAAPDMFLYLGDVYNRGTYAEFYNWYGTPDRFFGRFKEITNPIIGNHEYVDNGAGYFRYWNGIPHYYSYDAGGWHFVALDSNEVDQWRPGAAQYDWLREDLAARADKCIIAYFHHPVFSVGPQGDTAFLAGLWELLAQYGVEIVLAGHDHSYQRWQPLDSEGRPDPEGVAQFVVGSGGHGIQPFEREDERMAVGFDDPGHAIGTLYMELNPKGANFRYINVAGHIFDQGVIPCIGAEPDTEPPGTPAALDAANDENGFVTLTWEAARDDTGVESYTVYRDGAELATVGGGTLTYVDTGAGLNVSRSYQVVAADLAGNRGEPADTAAVARPAEALMRFHPVADTYVSADERDENFGLALVLRADAEPDTLGYLRFDLRGLEGEVQSAVLRLYAVTTSGAGYAVAAADTADGEAWAETGMTFPDAPPVGRVVAESAPYDADLWTEVDVSRAIQGAGELTLVVLSNNDTTLNLASRESEQPPELLVEVAARPSSLQPFTRRSLLKPPTD